MRLGVSACERRCGLGPHAERRRGPPPSCRQMTVLALLIAALILTGCGDDEGATTVSASTPGAGNSAGRAIDVRVPCGSGWFETEADRADTISVGRLAFDGEGLGYAPRRRFDDYLAKAPLAIEGVQVEPVTVTVLKRDQGRIGLAYGQIEASVPRQRAATKVTLKPCSERPRTSFIGALLLHEPRSIVKLSVKFGPGEERVLRLPASPGGLPE